MAKHSTAFKLQVFATRQSVEAAQHHTAERFQLDNGTVRKVFSAYQLRGPEGLVPRYCIHSAAFKLKVLKYLTRHSLRSSL